MAVNKFGLFLLTQLEMTKNVQPNKTQSYSFGFHNLCGFVKTESSPSELEWEWFHVVACR